jgi:hypothetical protein
MDVLKKIAMLEALKWNLFKCGKIEDIQAQEVDMVFLFILIEMSYYQERCNISLITKSKVLLRTVVRHSLEGLKVC